MTRIYMKKNIQVQQRIYKNRNKNYQINIDAWMNQTKKQLAHMRKEINYLKRRLKKKNTNQQKKKCVHASTQTAIADGINLKTNNKINFKKNRVSTKRQQPENNSLKQQVQHHNFLKQTTKPHNSFKQLQHHNFVKQQTQHHNVAKQPTKPHSVTQQVKPHDFFTQQVKHNDFSTQQVKPQNSCTQQVKHRNLFTQQVKNHKPSTQTHTKRNTPLSPQYEYNRRKQIFKNGMKDTTIQLNFHMHDQSDSWKLNIDRNISIKHMISQWQTLTTLNRYGYKFTYKQWELDKDSSNKVSTVITNTKAIITVQIQKMEPQIIIQNYRIPICWHQNYYDHKQYIMKQTNTSMSLQKENLQIIGQDPEQAIQLLKKFANKIATINIIEISEKRRAQLEQPGYSGQTVQTKVLDTIKRGCEPVTKELTRIFYVEKGIYYTELLSKIKHIYNYSIFVLYKDAYQLQPIYDFKIIPPVIYILSPFAIKYDSSKNPTKKAIIEWYQKLLRNIH